MGLILSAKVNENNKDYKTDMHNSFNLSPFVGVEYSLNNGVFFDARYNRGITDLSKINKNIKIYNDFFQVGIGYKLK